MVTADLAYYSLVAVYSAMAIYTISFVAFALDLAKRSGDAQQAAARAAKAEAVSTASVSRSASGGSTVVLDRPSGGSGAPVASGAGSPAKASSFERVAIAMMLLGFVVHVASVVLRGLAAGRVPWANMFEFSLTGTAIIVGVYLAVQLVVNLRFLGAYVMGLNLVLLAIGTVNYYVAVSPLPPALQSAWLVIHVFVAILGTAFFAIAAGLSAAQLVQTKREQSKLAGLRFMDTLPGAERLEDLAYRIALVGFVLWTFTLIAGAIWAERAWGRYWGWDTKEVWTFIIWVLYAGYIHARATRGWRGARSSWLSIIGFAAVMFNFSVVNVFFKGLHAYSGL
ncbi:c-type cytochrome biogenesis protein CcsB [Frigoribacterium sp. VKM Ac-2836]|uniref:c-type cytochrome biogenesis protein CcsB n=1 Tax=Frigoribacterium sp. VKM Ac-2836 TaxID=2739014 RepID=UPI00156442E2|nr:c-type cytochrome biogenesis protein CcsB [Frigoribacterium sp. VKM Ac-2836]NRD25242.1 c-type cytochrome biogenesis protein CcsB [Frigoribacterium sp. VKM Ac-2836]